MPAESPRSPGTRVLRKPENAGDSELEPVEANAHAHTQAEGDGRQNAFVDRQKRSDGDERPGPGRLRGLVVDRGRGWRLRDRGSQRRRGFRWRRYRGWRRRGAGRGRNRMRGGVRTLGRGRLRIRRWRRRGRRWSIASGRVPAACQDREGDGGRAGETRTRIRFQDARATRT